MQKNDNKAGRMFLAVFFGGPVIGGLVESAYPHLVTRWVGVAAVVLWFVAIWTIIHLSDEGKI